MPKSRCASITSRPLLTSVAELVVTTGPMSQVGCASACSGVTSRSCVAGPARGTGRRSPSAPAGDLVGAPAAQALGERGVLGVDGHDLARLRPPRSTSGPPDDERLLVGQRQRCGPAASAASVGARPIEPVIPLSTTSQSAPARSVEASGPASTSGLQDGPRPAAAPASLHLLSLSLSLLLQVYIVSHISIPRQARRIASSHTHQAGGRTSGSRSRIRRSKKITQEEEDHITFHHLSSRRRQTLQADERRHTPGGGGESHSSISAGGG